jgi:mono/diheme cytochrome c family protein
MTLRFASAWLVAFGVAGGAACAQEGDEVQQGHHLATLICSPCHIAARDQPFEPILRPPAPSFESIAQRNLTTNESVQKFLNTTHKDIGSPKGMPNPQLLDYQIRQIAAYLLSLRKAP